MRMFAICLVVGLMLSNSFAANHPDIENKILLLQQKISEVLMNENPELVKSIKFLKVGSWGENHATALSDIDLTIGAMNDQDAKRIAQKLQQAIASTGEAGKNINIMAEFEYLNAERFRGEAGQAFLHQYVNKTKAELCWVVQKNGNNIFFNDTSSDRFWIERNRTIPDSFTRGYTFIEDQSVFIARLGQSINAIEDRVKQAMATAKYLNNIETFLKPSYTLRFGEEATLALGMDGHTRNLVQKILELKNTPNTDFVEGMKKIFAASDDQMLDAILQGFVDNAQTMMEQNRNIAEAIEYTGRTVLSPSGNDLISALELKAKLINSLSRIGITTLAAIDLYNIIDTYREEGANAALVQTTTTLLSYGVPVAGLVGLLADIGKNVLVGTISAGGNYFIFEPINNSMIEAIIDENNVFSLFSLEQSPFLNSNLETIYYKLPADYGDEVELLRAATSRYVHLLSAWTGFSGAGVFSGYGPSQIDNLLLPKLIGFWRASKSIALNVEMMDLKLKIGIKNPPLNPLNIRINNYPIRSDSTLVYNYEVDSTRSLLVNIQLGRSFGTHQFLLTDPKTNLLDVWGAEAKGMKGLKKWIDERMVNEFEHGFNPIAMNLTIKGGKGWTISGNLPTEIPTPTGETLTSSAMIKTENPPAFPYQKTGGTGNYWLAGQAARMDQTYAFKAKPNKGITSDLTVEIEWLLISDYEKEDAAPISLKTIIKFQSKEVAPPLNPPTPPVDPTPTPTPAPTPTPPNNPSADNNDYSWVNYGLKEKCRDYLYYGIATEKLRDQMQANPDLASTIKPILDSRIQQQRVILAQLYEQADRIYNCNDTKHKLILTFKAAALIMKPEDVALGQKYVTDIITMAL